VGCHCNESPPQLQDSTERHIRTTVPQAGFEPTTQAFVLPLELQASESNLGNVNSDIVRNFASTEGKGKFCPCALTEHHAMKAYQGMEL